MASLLHLAAAGKFSACTSPFPFLFQQLRHGRLRSPPRSLRLQSDTPRDSLAVAPPTTAPSTTTLLPALTPQQSLVLDAIKAGQSVFFTGSAGTGKTTLLRHAISALNDIRDRGTVFVTASTGIASCAIDGLTLHSFAGIGFSSDSSLGSLVLRVFRDRNACRRWREAQTLIIDEVSMIHGQLFDHVDSIARLIRAGGSGKDLDRRFTDEYGDVHEGKLRESAAAQPPWGGIQLVVCGDFFQLPPVKPPNIQKQYAFEADCWDSSFDLQVELTDVLRQSDPQLICLLERIRRGSIGDCERRFLLDRRRNCQSNNDDSVTHLFPRNKDVQRVNEERLLRLEHEKYAFKAYDTGSKAWQRQLNQGIAPAELRICVGAKVMLTKNLDTEEKLVNGVTGVVTEFVGSKPEVTTKAAGMVESNVCSGHGLLPVVRFDSGAEIVVRPECWEVTVGERVVARRWQLPLILAWALSVHKCQGMTMDRMRTDLSRAFGCGMVYVALSRVRSLEGLGLVGFCPNKVMADPKVVRFYQRLHDSGGRRIGKSKREQAAAAASPSGWR